MDWPQFKYSAVVSTEQWCTHRWRWTGRWRRWRRVFDDLGKQTNKKSKRVSARGEHRHAQTRSLKPCRDKSRRSWQRWFVTGDWVKQRRPSACHTAEELPSPGCFVAVTGTPLLSWPVITRILLVNQHQGPPVQNKEKLKINLLTGESLGRALLPV